MTSAHWSVLVIYFGFTLAATLLALARRWLRPGARGGGVWRKYPAYILINLVFLAACWSPPEWHFLTILLALLGAAGAWEIARALPHSRGVILFPALAFALILASGFSSAADWFSIWLVVFFSSAAFTALTGNPAEYPPRALALAGCVIYLPLCLAGYLWIQRGDPSGFRAVFLYLVIAANDAFAQISGELIGRRQLTPKISPAKTIEGAAGGVLFAGLIGLACSQLSGFSHPLGAVLGLTLGLAGVVGDLMASMWKRALGIKNYSALLGAQGGVMDRFDGLIFAAPVFYLLLAVVS